MRRHRHRGVQIAMAAQSTWDLSIIDVDDPMLAATERVLRPVAERAKVGDTSARNALFLALQPKITRFVRKFWCPFSTDGPCGEWHQGDVQNEAFLVFVGVVDRWPPSVPFGRYFLANFPWRLRDAVSRRVSRRGIPPRSTAIAIDAPTWRDTIPDVKALDAQDRALIEALASSFRHPQDVIVRCHVLKGLTLAAPAERLGVNRRTVTRHWRSILQSLRV